MEPYYDKLYAHICTQDETPSGSGICVDGLHIITCAHVVNSALGKKPNSSARPSGFVKVIFPQNEDVINETFQAEIVAWGWKDLPAPSPRPGYLSLQIKNDFAVVKLTCGMIDSFAPHTAALQFLKGSLSAAPLRARSFNNTNPALINSIDGTFGINDINTGTAIMLPHSNPKYVFFDFGSSGSPVAAEVVLENGERITGIAGYADFLNINPDQGSRDARLVHAGTIEKLLAEHYPDLKLDPIDIDKKNFMIMRHQLGQEIIRNRRGTGQEILCDRSAQVAEVKNARTLRPESSRLFFIYGHERQKLDAFIDRYRYQFLAAEALKSQLLPVKMPKDKNYSFFLDSLVAGIADSFDIPGSITLSDEVPVIDDIMLQLSFSQNLQYVLHFKIESDDFDAIQLPFYQWFFNDFLRPVRNKSKKCQNLHVFVSFYFRDAVASASNQDMVVAMFDNIKLPILGNVLRSDFEQWLDKVEIGDTHQKNIIKSFYPVKPEYDMTEIIELYQQAKYHLNKIPG